MGQSLNTFLNNIARHQATITAQDEALKKVSLLRLAVFVLSIIVIVVLANERLLMPLFIVVPLAVAGFAGLVKRYHMVEALRKQALFLKTINEQEVLRQENKLSGFATGEAFADRDHPYAGDLDIFGQHSLFQLINRATTVRGQALLAAWLSAPAAKGEILARQQAVQELSPNLRWRQHFQAAGAGFTHAQSDFGLLGWIQKPVQLLPYRARYLAVVIPLSLLSTWAAVHFIIQFLIMGNVAGVIPLTIVSLINTLVLNKVKRAAEEITANIREKVKLLDGYRLLMVKIETEKFHSEKLCHLQQTLGNDLHSAAGEIDRLRTILETFQLRGGRRQMNHFFYSIFNTLWFLNVYFVILTEKWKTKNAGRVEGWIAAVSELEALNSLAGFRYANPEFVFPEINDEPYGIHFQNLGHPLIGRARRVCNHFDLNGRGKIVVVTGSNMAGKSTFLRAVGINLVLGLTGAPCCATAAHVSNMKVFTSMRTQDNLEEGVSSFYAELKRIEQLLKLISNGEPIFFLLDEMFKGTNSQDRYKGGVSLVRQLSELNAFGLISTHDLELARLAGRHMNVANVSFNSQIREGDMIFSYALTEGICTDFNASELMKRSGIRILSDVNEISDKSFKPANNTSGLSS